MAAFPKRGVKLIVGLGNPGSSYQKTRHNAGRRAVENFAKRHRFVFSVSRSFKSLVATKEFRGHTVCLALPQTFMNLSGEAVLALTRKKNIAPEDIFIVCDDVALLLGALKIKPCGSAGGHNGLASIIERLGITAIARLRIGIGSGDQKEPLSDYVLSLFRREEESILEKVLETSVSVIEAWILEGIEPCMNHFNTKNKNERGATRA